MYGILIKVVFGFMNGVGCADRSLFSKYINGSSVIYNKYMDTVLLLLKCYCIKTI